MSRSFGHECRGVTFFNFLASRACYLLSLMNHPFHVCHNRKKKMISFNHCDRARNEATGEEYDGEGQVDRVIEITWCGLNVTGLVPRGVRWEEGGASRIRRRMNFS